MSGEYSRSETNGNGTTFDGGSSAPGSPAMAMATPTADRNSGGAPQAAGVPEAVEKVIYSDIGISTLLNRLKQSIASARDFAAFLKKRSSLEEEQATGLKRLSRSQLETLRRLEVKSGSYASQLAEVMRVHERMADNGMQFALSLHQMHEDLNELSTNMERGRKQWKHEGLDAEKRASDAEAAMQKARSRYDTLAEDYDRARTGGTKGSKRIGLKGPKSAEQYEQDLLRKTQAADQEYEERVKSAQGQRERLISGERPKAVKALQELIRECDSALTLQLQKFATFNERLLLGNGLAVTPLTDKENASSQKSMRDVISEIDNETDFHSYMRGHVNKIPARPSEIKYEQHPTLMPKTQKPSDNRNVSGGTFSHSGGQQITQPLSLNTAGAAAGMASQATSANSRYSAGTSAQQQQPPTPLAYGQQPPQSAGYQQGRPSMDKLQSPTYGSTSGGPPQLPQHNFQQSPAYNPSAAPMRDGSYGFGAGSMSSSNNVAAAAAPPYPTNPTERNMSPSGGGPGYQQTTGSIPSNSFNPPSRQYTGSSNQPTSPPQHNLPPLRPVFGVSLDELFARDQSAVPTIVLQCILAVDTFGLDVEGIYRLSGTAAHVNALKNLFDHNPQDPVLDFRNPANFWHDVNSVATLMKQFFRELPDPLFTRVGYQSFIEAARLDDENQRRDALHQSINDLPDPNYATLRALILHLHRVMQNEGRNRMGNGNLAVCFAPSLMGQQTGGQIADASLQARVVDTILVNATAIFDED